jgi:hypothetical protein
MSAATQDSLCGWKNNNVISTYSVKTNWNNKLMTCPWNIFCTMSRNMKSNNVLI